MKRLPDPSTATPDGQASWALVAAPPSPEKPCVPVPATVVMIPLSGNLPDAVVDRVRDEEVARPVNRNIVRTAQLGARGGPPSPEKPNGHCPPPW